jgi:hypothetical protein
MALYEIVKEPGEIAAPALIVSFEDWVDAGSSGSIAARHVSRGGEIFATFDTDALFDYRSHRPILDIVDGIPKRFEWPQLAVIHRRLPERDLFVLRGPEPDLRWKEFAEDVLKLALRIGIIEHVSIGSIPSAVPHTVPTTVMSTSSGDNPPANTNAVEGLLRVPAAAVSAVEWTMASNGIPAVGFWAQVPHYASPYTGGAIALIRRLESHLSVTIGVGDLEEEDARQRAALQEIIAGNPEAQKYVERLEGLVGEQEIPSAENIAQEVERFLRDQDRRDEGPTPFSP